VQVNLEDGLLLARGFYVQSAWHIAAERGNAEILEKLWSWFKEVQVNLKDYLIASQQ
jgi:hypothetical protein